MRAVVQRVSRASVTVVAEGLPSAGEVAGQIGPGLLAQPPAGCRCHTGEVAGQIGPGLLVYAAAAPDDSDDDVGYIADKVAHLRIFPDADGKMNLDVCQIGGQVLLVSAFTLLADARKGRRPSFDASAAGEIAQPRIDRLAYAIRGHGLTVATGRFGAYMHVESLNDGPICILLDSRRVV